MRQAGAVKKPSRNIRISPPAKHRVKQQKDKPTKRRGKMAGTSQQPIMQTTFPPAK